MTTIVILHLGDVPDSFMMDFVGPLSSMSNFEARRQ